MKRMRVWIGKVKGNEEDKVKENINKEDESKRWIRMNEEDESKNREGKGKWRG